MNAVEAIKMYKDIEKALAEMSYNRKPENLVDALAKVGLTITIDEVFIPATPEPQIVIEAAPELKPAMDMPIKGEDVF
jgi:hypothetical protein